MELKNNLDSTAKYQILVGQIAEYKEWPGEIIVVLCGGTDRNLRKKLDEYLKGSSFDLDEVRVVQKNVTTRRVASERPSKAGH